MTPYRFLVRLRGHEEPIEGELETVETLEGHPELVMKFNMETGQPATEQDYRTFNEITNVI